MASHWTRLLKFTTLVVSVGQNEENILQQAEEELLEEGVRDIR